MGAATGMEGGVQDGTEGGLMQAIAVASKEGEMLSLDQEVKHLFFCTHSLTNKLWGVAINRNSSFLNAH